MPPAGPSLTGEPSLPSAEPQQRRVLSARTGVRARAVAGGVLCAGAAMGLWWAFERADAVPDTSYLVARSPLIPGNAVETGDIGSIPIRLPDEVAATAVSERAEVLGGVVVRAVHVGELLSSDDVVQPDVAATRLRGYTIAVELDRARALNGSLVPGERVDVIAIDRDDPGGGSVIAPGAAVFAVAGASDVGALSGALTVTLHVAKVSEATAVAAAADENALTLARVWP